jgi:hypothetical protein
MQLNSLELLNREIFKHLIHDVTYLFEGKLPGSQVELLAHREHILVILDIIVALDLVDQDLVRV